MDRRHVEPSELQVGDYVDYKPEEGNYIVDGKYSGVETKTYSTQTDLKWRVWKVENGNLYLISNEPSNTELKLSGPLGYNNGVTLLDNICKKCYSNYDFYGIETRSLRLEDITAVVTVSNSQESIYGKRVDDYMFKPPYIWTQYERGEINEQGYPISNANAINNKSIAYELTTNTTSSQSKISPYYTLWSYSSINAINKYTNEKYKELVSDPSNHRAYWLATRFVQPVSSKLCIFGMSVVANYSISNANLYAYGNPSSGYNGTDAIRYRPIIQIPINTCILKKSLTNGIDYDIYPVTY